MTTYVIRENSFFYDDSYDAYEGSRIASYFTDRAAAEAEYKRLEIEATRYIILWNQETLWNAQEAFEPELKFLKELDAFVFSCCGQHLLEDGRVKIELPENMQDDDIFEFVQRAGIQKYEIFEFEEESMFYAIWLNYEEEWVQNERETGTYLIYGISEEAIWQEANCGYCINNPEDFIFNGQLECISDAPILLHSVLQQRKSIQYDEKNQKITIGKYDIDDILAINPLLKKPIFEVKALSLQQVLEIEQKIAQQKYE